MSALKENRGVVLNLPKHHPRKLVREETTILSAPKTKPLLRIPLKRKRTANEDQDSDEIDSLKTKPQKPLSTSPHPNTLPPHPKKPFPRTVGNVKFPHDFTAPFNQPHFTSDKRKLHSRCNITIDLTFKRIPTLREIAARWRVPPELMMGWEVRKRWLEGEE
ncbi:hypothetical protein CPB85DRAFT_1261745 [Mucidula mucida]|nr:hypothetical protein CPB85DRAFT_1261745 [Mucidula mucida]